VTQRQSLLGRQLMDQSVAEVLQMLCQVELGYWYFILTGIAESINQSINQSINLDFLYWPK